MRAIILAAGRGSRLGSITHHQPKCLTPLAGKPLLQWQIDALHAAGVLEIGIVRGYCAEAIPTDGLHVWDNPRWQSTNMVGTLQCACAWLESAECLVCYADIVYHPEIITHLVGSQASLAITYDRQWQPLWGERFSDPLADAETFRTNRAEQLQEIGGRAQSLADIQGQYMGLLRFTPDSWGRTASLLAQQTPDAQDRLDMTTLLRCLLQFGQEIETVPVDGRWCEVDDLEDLALYERHVQSGHPWPHDWRWKVSKL